MADRVTFQDLSFRQKLDHIWTYYRYFILAGLFVILILVPLIIQTFQAPKSLLDVIMLDSNITGDSAEAGFTEFLQAYGYESYDGAVSVNTNLSFYSQEELEKLDEMSYSAAVQDNYEKQQILFTLMAAGGTEILFGKGDIFMDYADQGMLADLSTVLSPELLDKYAGQLVYTDQNGETEPYPCAIELSGSEWLSRNRYYEECLFGVLALANDSDIAAQFAEFLLNYPQ